MTTDSAQHLSIALEQHAINEKAAADHRKAMWAEHAREEIARRFGDTASRALTIESLDEDPHLLFSKGAMLRVHTSAASLYLIVIVVPEEYDEGDEYNLFFYTQRPTLAARLARTAGKVRNAHAAMNLLAGK